MSETLQSAAAGVIGGKAAEAGNGKGAKGEHAGGGTVDYRPNADAVGNMKEFLSSEGLGSQVNSATRKTSQ